MVQVMVSEAGILAMGDPSKGALAKSRVEMMARGKSVARIENFPMA